MERKYLKVLVMLLTLLVPALASSQLKVWDENFEDGVLPSGWTQVYEAGNTAWEVQTGNDLTFPDNDVASGMGRMRFSASVGTIGKTKLLTPMTDLSSLDAEFMLTYRFAMEMMGNQLDTLRIYYRTTENGPWELSKAYETVHSYWTNDTIFMWKSGYDQIQFAFEGISGGGRGVVLDNVVLSNRVWCSTVQNLNASNITHSTARLSWQHESSDIAEYIVKVDTKPIEDYEATGLFYDNRVTTRYVNLTGLQPGTTYYYSVKSDCGYGDEGGWSSGSFTTGCAPVATLDEDFESYDSKEGQGGVGFGCWTNFIEIFGDQEGGESASNYPYVNNSATYASSGTKSLRVHGWYRPNDGTNTTGYAVSPALADTVDLKTKQLSFTMYSASREYKLHIGISEYPDNLSQYEEVAAISCENEKIKQKRTVYLNNYTGTGKYIVFSTSGGDNNASSTIYIDDVKLESLSTDCQSIRIMEINATPGVDNVQLSWNAVNTTQWQLKVSTLSIDPNMEEANVKDEVITDNPCIVSGLAAGQNYYYYLRPVCSEGVYGPWSSEGTFTTACDPNGITSFPYRENFDTWGTGTSVLVPACWRQLKTTGRSYVHATSYTSPGSLYFNVEKEEGYILNITPKMGMELSKLTVSFMASGTRDHFIIVGAFPEESENEADFVPIDTVYIAAANTSTWEKFTVDLSGYTGEHRCIAFKAYPYVPYTARSFYLDNLLIEENKSCVRPTNLNLVDVTPTSVSLKWDKGGDELAWDVTYTKQGSAIDETVNPVENVTAGTEVTISDGLVANTSYDFYVRSICGENGVSDWEGPLSVSLPQLPATVPYTTGFDSAEDNAQWTLLNGTYVNKWRIGTTDETSGASLFVSSNGIENNYVNTSSYLFAYRVLDIPAGLYDIKFRWKAEGQTTNDFLRAFLVPDDVVILESDNNDISATATPAGWISLSTEKLNLTKSEWNDLSYTGIIEEGTYKLVFYWANNASTNNPPAAVVDDISIALNKECMTPVVEMSKLYDTSAFMTITDFNAASWELKVSETEVPIADVDKANDWLFDDTLTEPTHAFSDLKPGTTYYYYVKSDCAEEWLTGSFTTRCERMALPLIESFDSYPSTGAVLPDCWSRMRSATTGIVYPSVYSTNYEGGRGLRFNVSGKNYVLAVTPMLDVENFQGKQLSFYLQCTVVKDFKVGVMTDADDLDSFVEVEVIRPSAKNTWEYYEIPLDNYSGDGKFIAFLLDSDATTNFVLDELRIEQAPPCRNPARMEVTNITASSADLSWTGFASAYNVQVSSTPFLNETDTGNVYNGIVEEPKLTLTNLRGAQSYYWAVQAVCDEEDAVSDWVLGPDFVTECPALTTIPYRENFDGFADGTAYPDCWNLVRNYGSSEITDQYAYSLPNAFYIHSGSTGESIFATPELDVEDISELTVSFRASISTSSKLIVGVITDVDKPYTFTAIDTIPGESSSDYVFLPYEVDLADYQGSAKFVAFKSIAMYAARIDDIYIYRTNAHRPPTEFFVTNITDSSAYISWIEPQPMPQEGYRMKVSTYPIIPETDEANVGFIQEIGRANYNLTGLEANSTYYVYVQGVYQNGELGEWSDAYVLRTNCAPVALPYKESFDTYGGTGTAYFPDIWRYNFITVGSTFNTDYVLPYITSDGAEGAKSASLILHSAYVNISGVGMSTVITDVAMPPFAVDSVKRLQMTFKFKSEDNANVSLVVGVLDDYLDETTFTAVDTFYTNSSTDWSATQLVSFANYTGNGKYIAFRADHRIKESGLRSDVRIDDITVELIPDCAAPTKISGAPTDRSLTFTWNAGNEDDTEWTYALTDSLLVLPEDATDEELLEIIKAKALVWDVATTNSCTIDELQPNTIYYFYIASGCGTLNPSPYSIETLCAKEAIPYIQTFNEYSGGSGLNTDFPECWTRMDDLSTTIARPQITVEKGDTLLELWGSTLGYCIAVTPELDTENMKGLRARFKAMKKSATTSVNRFIIGIMTDPTDTATFVAVDTIMPVEQNVFKSFRIPFASYQGEGRYVAFYVPKGFSKSHVYMDDLIIEETVDCDMPENLQIVSRTADGFTVTWDKKNAEKWEVMYLPAGINPEEAESDTVTVEESSCTLDKLSANTLYDVYVRTVCSEEDQSEWSEKLTIRTLQENPEQIPFIADFEDDAENKNWTIDNGNSSTVNKWVMGNAVAFEGSGSLYVSKDGGSSNEFDLTSTTYAYAYRTIDFPVGKYDISFMWKNGSSDNSDYIRAFLVPEATIIRSGEDNGISSMSTVPAGWINVGIANEDDKYLNDKPEWTESKVNCIIEEGLQGRYNLVFYWKNNERNGNQPAGAIDNVRVEKSLCTEPEDLKAFNITETSADLTWMNYNSESWQLKVFDREIALEDVDDETAIYDEVVTSLPHSLTGLTIGTRYYYYVKADCLDSWVDGNFMTLCDSYELPYVEDFDSYGQTGTAYFPDCWTKFVTTTSHQNTYLSTYGGSNVLVIMNGNTSAPGFSLAATPPLHVDSMTNVHVSFDVRGWSSSNENPLLVGVIEAPEDYETFTPVDTIWPSSSMNWDTDVEVSFESYQGNGKRVALQSLCDETNEKLGMLGVYIDNVRVGAWEEFHYTPTPICKGYGYRGYGFDIPRKDLENAGDYTFERRALNHTLGSDSIIYLHLTVVESIRTEIDAVICEGETYTENGFNVSEEGKHQITYTSVSGCDSVVFLNLKVNPKYEFIETITTCFDALPYEWRGKTIEATGVYRDSLTTVNTGCDSIYVLDLSVVREERQTLNETICSDEKYFFKGEYLTVPGTYVDTLPNRYGCDSIVTLNLTVNQAYNIRERVGICSGSVYDGFGFTGLTQTGTYVHEELSVTGCDSVFTLELFVTDAVYETIRDTICEGSVYTLYGFNETEAGVYYQTHESATGCDSTITLHLTVMPSYEIDDEVVIQKSDLPYTYGDVVFDENTVSDTYRLEFNTTFGCDSIINLTLVIEDENALFNPHGEYFSIIPNPVKLGEPISINYDFTAEEKDGLRVEIFNSAGVLVNRYDPELYPISLTDKVNAPGVYMIRVITGNNKVLYGRIIVL